VLGVLGLAVLGMPAASGASFDCNGQWLSRAELTICNDPQLLRQEEQMARRLDSFAPRLNLGQYLGLRHWHATWRKQRNECATDRACIIAGFRAQARYLDRFQRCVSASLSRRACLRDMLAGERESMRR
jgi:uncharacterized protein